MADKQRYSVAYRRKRERRTDYRNRLDLLKSGKNRLVIRKTNTNIIAQIVSYDPSGDKVLFMSHSHDLKKQGWKFSTGNLPAAYLTGVMVGAKARKNKVSEAILDMGTTPSVKGSRIYACVKGALDAGLTIPCSKEILPSEDRIIGKHIDNYRKKAQGHHFKKSPESSIADEVKIIKQKILG
jgi:large subunit ribosomal protein L18